MRGGHMPMFLALERVSAPGEDIEQGMGAAIGMKRPVTGGIQSFMSISCNIGIIVP
jgi:hypothetical protein